MWSFWFRDRRSGHAFFSAPVYESKQAALYYAYKKLGEIGLKPEKVQIHTEERTNDHAEV